MTYYSYEYILLDDTPQTTDGVVSRVHTISTADSVSMQLEILVGTPDGSTLLLQDSLDGSTWHTLTSVAVDSTVLILSVPATGTRPVFPYVRVYLEGRVTASIDRITCTRRI